MFYRQGKKLRLEDLIISGTERVFLFFFLFWQQTFIISDAGAHQCNQQGFQKQVTAWQNAPQRGGLTKHPLMD